MKKPNEFGEDDMEGKMEKLEVNETNGKQFFTSQFVFKSDLYPSIREIRCILGFIHGLVVIANNLFMFSFWDFDEEIVGKNGKGFLWAYDIEEEGFMPSLTG